MSTNARIISEHFTHVLKYLNIYKKTFLPAEQSVHINYICILSFPRVNVLVRALPIHILLKRKKKRGFCCLSKNVTQPQIQWEKDKVN